MGVLEPVKIKNANVIWAVDLPILLPFAAIGILSLVPRLSMGTHYRQDKGHQPDQEDQSND